ncbi:MAG: DivIVA domain-containing protein [Candidatus Rokubacteria bacterium]|nr:DivIVA domain-containing protein [Candidatus Rokubacteria bacterium]
MRLSPADIRQQQFSERMFRGFDRDEVDRFLDQIAEDYESVIKENALLKEQLAAFEERSRSTAELEKNLRDTLVTTQKLTDEMKASAKREAELILREAQLAGEKTVEDSRAEEARIQSDVKQLKRTRRQLIEDLKATIAQYQRIVVSELGGIEDGDDEPA